MLRKVELGFSEDPSNINSEKKTQKPGYEKPKFQEVYIKPPSYNPFKMIARIVFRDRKAVVRAFSKKHKKITPKNYAKRSFAVLGSLSLNSKNPLDSH